ncbi:glycosyltransferase [Benzoatithermus flavus]|uniref:Glycosyltransferase n=1 Tax=Benzoatithermus flavus TaxID=3108223 RepID=A0ABU8XXS6_9PROT
MHPEIVFVLALLAAVLAGLGLHPFTTYPLSLVLLRAWRGGRAAPPAAGGRASDRPASVAIVFCAYNEEKKLPAKLANVEALLARHPELSVHVYSDGSSDRTDAILQEHAARHAPERFRVVLGRERAGKSTGMNRLLAGVTSELVVFTDADIKLRPDLVANLRRHFADPAVGCVCGHLVPTRAGAGGTAATNAGYRRFDEWLKHLESGIDTTVAANGGLFAIRRALFRPVPPDIIDDMFTSVSILCDGYRLVHAADVVGDEEPQASPGAEMRRKRRIACRCFRCHRLLWPRLRRLPWLRLYMYLSHKYLRWWSGALLAAAGMLAALTLVLARPLLGGAVLALALLAAGLACALQRRLFEIGRSVLVGIVSPSLGVADALAGRTYVVWAPGRGSA